MLLIDVDYFKSVNDKYGHAVGDEYLIIVSNALQNVGPENKLCTRIGGEELAIIYLVVALNLQKSSLNMLELLLKGLL